MVDENPNEKRRWYHDLSVMRWIFVIFGILIMLYSGGCSVMLFADYLQHGKDIYGFNSPDTIMGFGGLTFLVGLLIWLLAALLVRNKPNQ